MTDPQTFLKVTRASDIKPQRQKWLYAPDGDGVIPLQTGSVFAGIGGEGKSSFAIYLAALLSRGELEGDLHGLRRGTIIFGPEDDWATAMVPRLMAAGADLQRVFKVSAEVWTPYGAQEQELKFPLDIQHLEDAVNQTGAKLIVVDPISTSMTGDMNKVQDVRDALGALTALAQRHDLAIIAINHFNKSGTSVASKMSGSHAIRDVVRSYLAFGTDEETGERIITQDKNNYGTGFGSWKFVLENTSVQIPEEDQPAEVPTVRMLGASDVTVKDLIDREGGEGEDDDRNAAQDFVLDFIKENGDGEAKAGDVIKAGRAAGFSENEIKHARRRCKDPKIISAKSAFGSGWVWQIEESSQGATDKPQGAQGAKNPDTAPSLAPSPTVVQDATKNPLLHEVAPSAPSAPSSENVAPSRSLTCPEHGTNYKIPTCNTCLQLAKEKTA